MLITTRYYQPPSEYRDSLRCAFCVQWQLTINTVQMRDGTIYDVCPLHAAQLCGSDYPAEGVSHEPG